MSDQPPFTGNASIVGITGAPGTGKSTLVDRLAAHYRRAGQTVGIIAIDPTSPFTGGAILGDRIRMQGHASDSGIFIRSMATRGWLGGLAEATAEVALVLDAAGKDVILIETVGVGQDEVDIVRLADCTLVLLVPPPSVIVSLPLPPMTVLVPSPRVIVSSPPTPMAVLVASERTPAAL